MFGAGAAGKEFRRVRRDEGPRVGRAEQRELGAAPRAGLRRGAGGLRGGLLFAPPLLPRLGNFPSGCGEREENFLLSLPTPKAIWGPAEPPARPAGLGPRRSAAVRRDPLALPRYGRELPCPEARGSR